MNQVIKAFAEAEAYPGPSLIIAYAQCILHRVDMRTGFELHQHAVDAGFWPLYRFSPAVREWASSRSRRFQSADRRCDGFHVMYQQNRFRILRSVDPDRAELLARALRDDIAMRWKMLAQWTQFGL